MNECYAEEKNLMINLLTQMYKLNGNESESFANLPIVGIHTKQIQERLNVLKYGLGARVYAVINKYFPQFKAKLTAEKWNFLGSQFTFEIAYRQSYIGLLPVDYYHFMKTQNLTADELLRLDMDFAGYELLSYNEKLPDTCATLDEISNLRVVRIHSAIRYCQSEDEIYLASLLPNQKIIFKKISLHFFEVIKKIKNSKLTIDNIASEFVSAQELAEFLLMLIECRVVVLSSNAL